MEQERRALVIVDMLNDFLLPDAPLSLGEAGRAVIPRVSALLERARSRGDLVIFIRDHHRTDDPEFTMFPPHCIAGTKGAQIIDELEVLQGDVVIEKRKFSAFFATELDLVLRENGIKHLDLCGVCTNICVLYTAAAARDLTYEVTVYRDAVAGTTPDAHEWALSEMENTLGCKVRWHNATK